MWRLLSRVRTALYTAVRAAKLVKAGLLHACSWPARTLLSLHRDFCSVIDYIHRNVAHWIYFQHSVHRWYALALSAQCYCFRAALAVGGSHLALGSQHMHKVCVYHERYCSNVACNRVQLQTRRRTKWSCAPPATPAKTSQACNS